MSKIELYKQTYDKHKHLKNAADELGIKWQNLYYHLNSAGHPVTGDKERYGSDKDKFAKVMEDRFKSLIPYAKDGNMSKFQATVDFDVKGLQIDVKGSTKKDGYKNSPHKNPALRWAFTTKVQRDVADYLVCYCMTGKSCVDYGETQKILLIPKEFFKGKQMISVSCNKSKWYDFEVTEQELKEFFDML